ncbi:LysM peptidoglycan-binding domain-containing protein [Neobacillus drentensis]|uniref:LysM peptidoglycan-binding domain-containing protein n=1 Tax=Neobacillus drentensis TaxID=220684 RepID=UPI003000B95B
MNNEEPFRDQAERLKRRIEKINEKLDDKENLPPREHIHRQKKKKTKWKLKYPVIRLLVLSFILLPIIIFSVISYQNGTKKVDGVQKSGDDSVETINLEKSNEAEETQVDNLDQSEEAISDTNDTEESKGQESQIETTSGSLDNTTDNENNTTVNQNSNNEQEKETETTDTTEMAKNSVVTHIVKPNENLYRLAMMYYHSPKGMDIIIKANNLQSKQINTGQVLKIPLNN